MATLRSFAAPNAARTPSSSEARSPCPRSLQDDASSEPCASGPLACRYAQPFDFFTTMLIPLLDAGEVRIGAVATGQVLLVESRFLLTRFPFASWIWARDQRLAGLPCAACSKPSLVTAGTHRFGMVGASWDEKMSCAPLLLTSGSLNSRNHRRRSSGAVWRRAHLPQRCHHAQALSSDTQPTP